MVRLVHLENASLPICERLSGNFTLLSSVHSLKASSGILSTPCSISTHTILPLTDRHSMLSHILIGPLPEIVIVPLLSSTQVRFSPQVPDATTPASSAATSSTTPASGRASSVSSVGSASAVSSVVSSGSVASSVASVSSVSASVSSGTSVSSVASVVSSTTSTVSVVSSGPSSTASAQAGVTSWTVMVRAINNANSFFMASSSFRAPGSGHRRNIF